MMSFEDTLKEKYPVPMSDPESTLNILAGIVNRGMKSMAIEHARKSGASPSQLLSFEEEPNSEVVWMAVTVIWGEPTR